MFTRLLLFILVTLFFSLTACKNRFETYEPYSYFDERMAMADRGHFVPDDQIPVGMNEYYEEVQDSSYDQPMRSSSPRRDMGTARRQAAEELEVPFDSSRQKHAVNIGAL